MARWRTIALAMLIAGSAQAAEHDFPSSTRVGHTQERVSFSLSNRAGLVKAPFVTTAFPEVSGFAMVLTGTAAVQWPSLGWLHLKLPLSITRLDFPAKAQVAETAVGNLELGLEHSFELRPRTRLGLVGALLVPSAEHGSEAALLDNRALALGSALNGGKDAALLTPGVTGVRLAASVEQALPPFVLRASLDLPVLVHYSRASLPDDAQTHAFGLAPALDLRAAWWATAWFGASLGAGLITEPWRVQEPARERERKRRLQALVEPNLHFSVKQHVALGLNGSIPLGGNLGGNAWSAGLYGRLQL